MALPCQLWDLEYHQSIIHHYQHTLDWCCMAGMVIIVGKWGTICSFCQITCGVQLTRHHDRRPIHGITPYILGVIILTKYHEELSMLLLLPLLIHLLWFLLLIPSLLLQSMLPLLRPRADLWCIRPTLYIRPTLRRNWYIWLICIYRAQPTWPNLLKITNTSIKSIQYFTVR